MTRPYRRTIALAAFSMLATLSGCTEKKQIHQIGEKVQLGGVVYSVLDTEWLTGLDSGGTGARTPAHRFLVVHLSMTNGGSKEATLPLLHIVGPDGAEHLELADGKGLPNWLGILRTLNPTETKDGRIVFDVPVGAYSIRLTDGSEQELEKTAMVVLPASPKQAMDSPILNDTK